MRDAMKMKVLGKVFASLHLLGLMLGLPVELAASESLVFIGTYTKGSDSEGIYVFRFDDKTGALTPAGTAGISTNPSFLALHPTKNLLFAVGETPDFRDRKTGSVAAFEIDPQSGKLTEVNRVPSYGKNPCHLVVDRTGKHLLVANYSSGNIAALRIGDDGKLGIRTAFTQHAGNSVNKSRQEGPHAHSINLDRAGRRAFVADLGIDQLVVYDYDEKTGDLRRHSSEGVEGGSGPRHLAIHPGNRFLYLLNELSSRLSVISYDPATGDTEQIQSIRTLPEDFRGRNSTAEVQVTPDGKFLYASNRGHDSLACYAIDAGSGKLTLVEIEPVGGKTPRNFGIHPGGKFIIAAHQNSNSLAVFAIDQKTGALSPTGHRAECPRPVCVTYFKPR